ncbi:LBP / BPI / CETP family N-terminal domain [Carpediemonas membranifera]|uniref:LBP / BPI / CETP family N-terminal domain n=1 Tax=Carpediemonas membranifera TaxID=201153 RepID=A0A8J6B939_9EUKA|nr:LBP / BPI / CETP family N-terminal domain [Carpediemonas membranifera]|eukprot:KAG9392547.1 LBP / BPI / CETP family N-terminal domain [Carpediemonas membranifera]
MNHANLLSQTFVTADEFTNNANGPYKVAITTEGLTKWSSTFVDQILDGMAQSKFPPISGWQQVALVGNVTYTISNLKLTSYTLGGLQATTDPKTKELVIVMSDFNPDATFDYVGDKVSFPHVHEAGTGSGSLKGATLTVRVNIHPDPVTLIPTETVTSCLMSVKDMNVSLHGGASWLIDMFVAIFKSTVIRMLEEQGSIQGTRIVKQVMHEQLSKWVPYYAFTNGDAWDERLVGSVEYGDNFAAFTTAGVTRYMNQSATLPGLSKALPDLINSKALQIFIHEEAIDSMIGTGFRHGYYAGDATKATAAPSMARFMNTDGWKSSIPGVRGLPSQDLTLHINANAKPYVKVFPAALYVGFDTTVTVKGSISGELATLNWGTGYSASMTTGPASDLFLFKFESYNQTLSVASSNVGDFAVTGPITAMFKVLGKGVANHLTALYDGSTLGIPTPLINNVEFSDVATSYAPPVLQITANFEPKKSADQI